MTREIVASMVLADGEKLICTKCKNEMTHWHDVYVIILGALVAETLCLACWTKRA